MTVSEQLHARVCKYVTQGGQLNCVWVFSFWERTVLVWVLQEPQ